MGNGIDIVYPSAHKEVARKMLSAGGLITEQPFKTKPDAHNFPARNRIIAGLCDALIVIEAAKSGGALITAEIANAYNKDVFALPGNHDSEYSAGCNWLIKINKANLLTSAKDIEYIMNWTSDGEPKENKREQFINLTPEETTIIEAIREKSNPVAIDELTIKTLLSPGVLANNLLTLELKGLIKALPGKTFKLA
jgi:DNA processing protein